MNNFVVKIILKIKRTILSPEQYARSRGARIGKNCFIADKHTFPSESYLVEIGDNCALTYGSRIFTHGGGRIARSQYPDFDLFGKVKIGNYVYIGSNAFIMPGVTIEDNVLVAAGSVVTKSIPSGYVVAGNPARIVCRVDDYIQRNLKYNTNTKNLDRKQKKKFLLSMEESKFITKPFMRL